MKTIVSALLACRSSPASPLPPAPLDAKSFYEQLDRQPN